DRADAAHLAQLSEYQSANGMEVERLTLRAARKLEPALSPQLAGAVHIPGDHQVNPRMFAAALLDALNNLGVVIRREHATTIPDMNRWCWPMVWGQRHSIRGCSCARSTAISCA